LTIQNRTERLIYHLLLLDPPAQPVESVEAKAARAERAFGFSLVFSGVRCVLQYVILPFVLPIIGLTSNAAVPLTLAINVVALGSVLYSLRRFWQINYQHKWRYLPIAITATILLSAFIVLDLHALLT
jgi:ABC-type iron transport system FetAB permease component